VTTDWRESFKVYGHRRVLGMLFLGFSSGLPLPLVFTTVALFLGFLTFAGSSFVPIRNFGQLTAVTIVAALLSNLIVLPALLATSQIITLWDLVGVKLGSDPTRTIPLLRGMRPAQARLVVLMGHLRSFAPGEAIVRAGETGREMYVMLEGSGDVWGGEGEQRTQLMTLSRGEIVMEEAKMSGSAGRGRFQKCDRPEAARPRGKPLIDPSIFS